MARSLTKAPGEVMKARACASAARFRKLGSAPMLWTRAMPLGFLAWMEGVASGGELESRRAGVAGVAARILLVITPVYAAGSWLLARQPSIVYGILSGTMLLALVALLLLRARQRAWAARVALATIWGTVATLVLSLGLHTPHSGAFHPALVAAGLLLSARGVVLTAAASGGVLILTAIRHRAGLYGATAPLFPDIVAPLAQLAATGTFIAAARYSFERVVVQLAAQQKELAQSAEQLRRAEKMDAFGQLAGGVAHDFNNILTGMLGHIDLLRMHAESGEVGAEFNADLRELERSAERAAEITRQLLAFSRKEAPDNALANVARVLEEAGPMLRSLTREDVELGVISELAARVPLAPASLEQILMNLVINANDAMPRGGALVVTTSLVVLDEPRETTTGLLAPGRYLALTVSDSGEGIPEGLGPRVFEPFFTTKPVGKGTGLGLSTVLGIVHRAGGQVEVRSSLGRGTTFTVLLPVVEDITTPPEQPRSLPPPPTLDGVLLLCEDDPTILRVMSQALRAAGFEVEATARPEEALERGEALRGRLALLITDVIMPGMNGRELAAHLEEKLGELPVLFISGYTAGLLSDLGIDAHDQRLLSKPFTPAELVKRVRTTLAL
jgi:signal transduction histidine kinase/CheY-like chemotaxis protein